MSIHQKIIAFVNSIQPLTQKMEKEIIDSFYEKSIKKNAYFLTAYEDLVKVGFINRGLFRYFYIDAEGKETTKYFAKENEFIISFTAFKGVKSPFFIQALESSRIICIQTKVLKTLIERNTDWLKLYVFLLEQSYLIKEKREADFLLYKAYTRYNNFNMEFPTLIDRVQQQHIASYLGITPESLSRILRNK